MFLTPAHEKRQKGAPEDIGVSDCKMDNRENARMHEMNMYANAMHMMTWQNATRKQTTRQQQRITGRHLAQQSRGVTTLHYYERILSRDLGWHRREMEEEEKR